MFWKTKVQISPEMYEHSWPIMCILRPVGVFPLVVGKTQFGLYLKLSIWCLAYSYMLGALIITIAYYGTINDTFFSKGESIKVVSQTDKIVLVLNTTGYFLIVFYGLFVMPTKLTLFVAYIKCINQVDDSIHTTYTKSDKYTPVIMLTVLFTCITLISSVDNYMYFSVVGDKIGLAGVLKRNLGLDMIIYVTVAIEYIGRHMAYSMEKRFVKLNHLLEEQYVKDTKIRGSVLCQNWMRRFKQRDHTCSNKIDATIRFRKAYIKLIEASDILNNFLGANTLIALLTVLFSMIVSSYFLILVLEGKRKGSVELIPKCLMLSTHVIRVLMITGPWYACTVQMETTKTWICKLLTLNDSRQYRKELHTFAMVLCLRHFQFSAYGLFTVDRYLFTSLIGTVTTYLVILLQAQANDKI